MVIEGYAELVRQHRPAGYELKRRRMTALDGQASFVRRIIISNELKGRDALFVFLHECGHVHMRHLTGDGNVTGSKWRDEYEADQYAIKAMREAGIPLPRDMVAFHKKIVRGLIEASDDHPEDEVLKYAYGKQWRQHR